MLFPPPPNHGNFYPTIGGEWSNNYENTKKLAEQLKLKCHIDWACEPISPLGTMFWFRPSALGTLFRYGWEYKNFPTEPNDTDGTLLHAVERIYGFVAQSEGYYPAWVMTDRFSRIEFTNLYFMLSELNKQLFYKCYTRTIGETVYNIAYNLKEASGKGKSHIKRFARRVLPKSVWSSLGRIKRFIK